MVFFPQLKASERVFVEEGTIYTATHTYASAHGTGTATTGSWLVHCCHLWSCQASLLRFPWGIKSTATVDLPFRANRSIVALLFSNGFFSLFSCGPKMQNAKCKKKKEKKKFS